MLLALAIGGVALLVSARADRMGQAVGWAAGFLIISYVIDYFATLWSFLDPLQPFSIFYTAPDIERFLLERPSSWLPIPGCVDIQHVKM